MNQQIIDKLYIGKLQKKAILDLPNDIMDFEGLEYDTKLSSSSYDLIFSFVFTIDELKTKLLSYVRENRLNVGGIIYFAYPKKGNKQYDSFIHRDEILPSVEMDEDGYVYGSSVKFNKMAALNDIFTVVGLKNVPRSKRSPSSRVCVRDFEDRIPEVENLLKDNPEVLTFFKSLTPGYQRGWARYVFGVKTAETTKKRTAEMIEMLRQGFKSDDLARRAKK